MNEQTKMIRQLELLVYLSSGIRRTVEEICSRFSISESTARRHIRNFRNIGFHVECKDQYYTIKKDSPFFKQITDLLVLSNPEVTYIQKLLSTAVDSSPLKTNILQRLESLNQINTFTNKTARQNHIQNICFLEQAIKENKQVHLLHYKSGNSEKISNRLVEPFSFSSEYESIWAYDLSDHQCKTFKIMRIGETVITHNGWQYSHNHKIDSIDLFGMSGSPRPISFEMTLRVKSLLVEEYPESVHFLTKQNDNRYLFEGTYNSPKGIVRFLLGVIDQIDNISSEELINEISEKIKSFQTIVSS